MNQILETKVKYEIRIDFEKLIQKLHKIPGEKWEVEEGYQKYFYICNFPFGKISIDAREDSSNYRNLIIFNTLGDKIYQFVCDDIFKKIEDERKKYHLAIRQRDTQKLNEWLNE